MQEYKQFSRRIGLIGATNILIGLSGLILLPILTKALPIEEYGTYVQITVTLALVPGIVMLGLPYTMVRFLAAATSREEVQEGYYSIASITMVAAGLTSLAFFVLAEFIAAALFDNRVAVAQILAAIVFLECINGLQFNYFRTFQQIKRYSLLTFFKTCLQLVLVGALVLAGYGIFGATIGLFITGLILFLVMGVLIVSEIGITIPKFKHLKEYLSFGLPTVPGNLSNWVVDSSDRYVVAFFLGAAYVGYYSPGYTLGNIVGVFIAPLSFMLPAVLSKYYDNKNLDNVRTVLSYSMKYFLVLAIPSIVGLTLLSKSLLTILSTPDIAAMGYLITPFVAICAFLYGIYTIAVQIIILHKKTRHVGFIWLIAAGLNIILNIIFIPIFGIIGAAVTTLISFCIATLYTVYHSDLLFMVNIKLGFIFKCIISSLIMGALIMFLDPWNVVEIMATVICSVCIYFGILLLLNGFSRDEFVFFKKMFGI